MRAGSSWRFWRCRRPMRRGVLTIDSVLPDGARLSGEESVIIAPFVGEAMAATTPDPAQRPPEPPPATRTDPPRLGEATSTPPVIDGGDGDVMPDGAPRRGPARRPRRHAAGAGHHAAGRNRGDRRAAGPRHRHRRPGPGPAIGVGCLGWTGCRRRCPARHGACRARAAAARRRPATRAGRPPPSSRPTPRRQPPPASVAGGAAAVDPATDSSPQANAAAPGLSPPEAPGIFLADRDGIRVLQSPGAPPEALTELQLDAISYDLSGAVTLSGRGAADTSVRVTLNNQPINLGEIGPGRAVAPRSARCRPRHLHAAPAGSCRRRHRDRRDRDPVPARGPGTHPRQPDAGRPRRLGHHRAARLYSVGGSPRRISARACSTSRSSIKTAPRSVTRT